MEEERLASRIAPILEAAGNTICVIGSLDI
jgi:hypothetical protein